MRTMRVADRNSGKIELIRENDRRFQVELRIVADRNDLTIDAAIKAMDDGQALMTVGFVRSFDRE